MTRNKEMREGAIADAIQFLEFGIEMGDAHAEYADASEALLEKKYTHAVDILECVITCTSCNALRSIYDGVTSHPLKVRIYQIYNTINKQLPLWDKAEIW